MLQLQQASLPARCLQAPCSNEQVQFAAPQLLPPRPSTSRRHAILLLPAAVAAAAVAVALPPAAVADGAVAAAVPAPAEPAAAVSLDVPSWPQWIDRSFSFSYPPGMTEVADLSYAAPALPPASSPSPPP